MNIPALTLSTTSIVLESRNGLNNYSREVFGFSMNLWVVSFSYMGLWLYDWLYGFMSVFGFMGPFLENGIHGSFPVSVASLSGCTLPQFNLDCNLLNGSSTVKRWGSSLKKTLGKNCLHELVWVVSQHYHSKPKNFAQSWCCHIQMFITPEPTSVMWRHLQWWSLLTRFLQRSINGLFSSICI